MNEKEITGEVPQMPGKGRRHQNDTKTFEELTFAEQAKAINIKVVWFLLATRNHIQKCIQEHGVRRAANIPGKVAQQLRSMADQLERLETGAVPTIDCAIVSEEKLDD
jgi:hypothetical protein